MFKWMLFMCHTWTKWIYYFDCTNVANENCDEFCMKEVFKCRGRRMMRWDELWTKAQAWGCPWHPKKYSRGTSVEAWGCPEASPFFITKISGHISMRFTFYCFLQYVLFLERLYFCFQFCFVLFSVINGWTPSYLFWRETRSVLIA